MFWMAEAVLMERARRAKSVRRERGACMVVMGWTMVELMGFPYNLSWDGNGDVGVDTILLNGAIEKLSRRTILSGPDMLCSWEKGFIEGV
jgi:hypothetical protein